MRLLALYEKIILLTDRIRKEIEQSKTEGNKVLMFFDSLKLYSLEAARLVVRFICLLFGDSAENFLIFSKLGKESVIFCNNSFCQYKKMERKVRFLSKTAFIMILVSTIVTSSVLYFFMPGKPSGRAATNSWIQAGWDIAPPANAGECTAVNGTWDGSVCYPTHASNKTGWATYESKDSIDSIVLNSGQPNEDKVLKLSVVSENVEETADTQFNGKSALSTDSTDENFNLGTPESGKVQILSGVKLDYDYGGGTGADGALVVSSLNTVLSAVNFSTTGTISAGATAVTLSATPTGLAVNDEIIIINLKGTSADSGNAGNYEFKTITAINTNTLTLNSALSYTYGDSTTQKIMVQRVPNYTDVTINSGASLIPSTWDGTKGGVLAFRSTGTVTVNAANGINANALGFAGGAGGNCGVNAGGGESYNGTGGSGGTSLTDGNSGQGGGGGGGVYGTLYIGAGGLAGVGGGGGGGALRGSSSTTKGGGGGGGGGGSAGSLGYGGNNGVDGGVLNGGGGGNSATYALGGGGGGGGNDGLTADGTGSSNLYRKAIFGGGGAAGGGARQNSTTCAGGGINGGGGGKGGGIIAIFARQITIPTGFSISANGTNGTNGTINSQQYSGGGGGGAGGSIIILTPNLSNSGSITSNGGSGGTITSGYAGGAGGGGRTYAKYASISGTAPSPNYYAASLLYNSSGTFTSRIFDMGVNQNFGKIAWTDNSSTVGGGSSVTMEVRSCANSNCSDGSFASVTNGGSLYNLNNKRYIQYRATLNSKTDLSATPTLSEVKIYYESTWNNVTVNANDIKLNYDYGSGDGADGALVVSSLNTVLSAVNFSTTGTINSGATTVTLSSTPTGLAVNDEIMIINLKGTSSDYSNTGNYEFRTITAINTNTLTLDSALSYTFGDSTTQKTMVQRVPNYTDVTISSGASLISTAWNGTKGGVLAFRATGTVTVGAANGINANGLGFSGAAAASAASGSAGGESYNGTGGSGGLCASTGNSLNGGGGGGGSVWSGTRVGGDGTLGNGGGGGGVATSGSNSSKGGGGGGGGNGSPGSGGAGFSTGSVGSNSNGGTGGSSGGNIVGGGGGGGGNDGRTASGAGSSTLNTRAYFGGGGGAGGAGAGGCAWAASSGGAGGKGGGVVVIYSNNLVISAGSSINSNGNNGGNAAVSSLDKGGGGGAGAGGSLIITAQNITDSGSIGANGGVGGAGGGTGSYSGGNGGEGRTYAKYGSFSGTIPTPNYYSTSIGYYSSGTFTSQIIDTGQKDLSWGLAEWSAATAIPSNTGMTVKVRSCDDSACSGETAFSGIAQSIAMTAGASSSALSALSSMVAGHRYFQYEVTMTSSDGVSTPTFSDLKVYYTHYPDTGVSPQTLVSSPYDTGSPASMLNTFSWNAQSGNLGEKPAGTNLKFRIRTAASKAGLTTASWCGPGDATNCDGGGGTQTYYETTSSGETINSTQSAGANDQWMQYKAWLESTDGSQTPVLSDASVLYVRNTPPCVGVTDDVTGDCVKNTITASQNSDASPSNIGKIVVGSYQISDFEESGLSDSPGDKDGGTVNIQYFYDAGVTTTAGVLASGNVSVSDPNSVLKTSGYIMIEDEVIYYDSNSGGVLTVTTGRGKWPEVGYTTLAVAHETVPTTVWVYALSATVKGDVTGVSYTENPIVTSGLTLDPASDLNSRIYLSNVKVRIALNDANGGGQVGTADSSNFAVDTVIPVYATPPFKINANASGYKLTDISLTESSTKYVRFANASNIDGSTCATDLASDPSATGWEAISATRVWTLSFDATNIATVCFQAKDNFNNENPTIKFVTIPANPKGMNKSDITVVPNSDYSLVVWWEIVSGATKYNVWRSTDGADYGLSPFVTINSGSTNYCYDEGDGNCADSATPGTLNSTTDYYYRVTAEDADGISIYSSVVSARPDGSSIGETPIGDTTPPRLISPLPVDSNNSNTSARITWYTDERSYSIVKYRKAGTSPFFIAGSVDKDDVNFVQEISSVNFSHTVDITGLAEGTQYEYQVLSADAAGLLMKSPNNPPTDPYYTFSTTSTSPSVTSGPTVVPGRDTATIYWQTNEVSDSMVNYIESTENDFTVDPAGGFSTALQTEKVTEHYVIINTNLSSGKFYNYQVIFSDNAATPNTATSPSAAPFLQFGTSTDPDSTKPVLISGPAPDGVSSGSTNSATITWNTNERSYSLVKYRIGAAEFSIAGSVNKDDAAFVTEVTPGSDYLHTVALSSLTSDSAYEYQVLSADGAGNLMEHPLNPPTDPYHTFTTNAQVPDIQEPSITLGPTVTPGRTNATVYWRTDEASTSQVKYVESTLDDFTVDPATGFSTATQTEKVTEHYVIIDANLASGRFYNYQVVSADAAATPNTKTYPNVSPYLQFETAGDQTDTTDPTIAYGIKLNQALDNSSTSDISLTSTDLMGSSGTIQIGDEHISYTSKNNTADTISGIARGSSPASHSLNDDVVEITDNTASLVFSGTDSSGSVLLSVAYEASDTLPLSFINKESTNPSMFSSGVSGKVTLEGLTSNTKYYYSLKARDVFGNLKEVNGASYYFTTTSDIVSPSAITDLAIKSPQSDNLKPDHVAFSWTSTGDNTGTGTATGYDLRYSTATIDDTNWGTATQIDNEPNPQIAGTAEGMTVAGLAAGTYYFAIKVSDEIPNESGLSNILTVIIPEARDSGVPTITANSVVDVLTTGSETISATITWDTTEASSSLVDFGPDTGTLSSATYTKTQGDSEPVYTNGASNHSVILVGLTPGTKYYYRVKSFDSSGNSDSKGDLDATYTFTTDTAALGTQPFITAGPTATRISATSFAISWTTDIVSDTVIAYGETGSTPAYPLEKGDITKNSTTDHSITLSGLAPSKLHNYQARSRNGDQVATAVGTFTTEASTDTAPPIFSQSPAVTSVTSSTAIVTWSTTESSDSNIYFGTVTSVTTDGYSSSKGNSTERVLIHSVSLSGLSASTTYYFRAKSVDASGNPATSEEYSFNTTAGTVVECPTVSCGGGSSISIDTTPPTISGIKIAEITATSATVSWETNEKSDSIVSYGADNKYGSIAGMHEDSLKTHTIILYQLEGDKLYNYKVSSKDSSGNLAQSDNLTFKTLAIEDLTPEEQKTEEEKQGDLAQEIQ
ncbi:MAG: fibronectin type III domain-containing protein, partial [Candidatus Paceibacterota bacterium]